MTLASLVALSVALALWMLMMIHAPFYLSSCQCHPPRDFSVAEPLSVVGILAVAPFPRKSYRSLDQAALPAPQDTSKDRNELHLRE